MQTVRYARHGICKTHGIGARLKGDWNVCGGQYYSSVFNSGPDLCKTRQKIHAYLFVGWLTGRGEEVG